MALDLQVRSITPEDCQPIRHAILRPNQSLADCLYSTDYDEGAFHLGVYNSTTLISTASFYRESLDVFDMSFQYRLRGMASLVEFRGKGAGRMLVHKGVERIRALGCQLLWCNARTTAAPYYSRLGFLQKGDVFDLPPLGPHKVMYLSVDP